MKNVTPKKRPKAEDEIEQHGGIMVDPEIVRILEDYPDARRVSARRYDESSQRWVRLGSTPRDIFSEDFIQKRHGGGLYQFIFHDEQGKMLRTITNIEIADIPEDERPARSNPTPAQVVSTSNPEVEILKMQIAQMNGMILKLLETRSQPVAPQNNITDLVAALAAMHKLAPQPVAQPGIQEIMAKSFEKGLELATKIKTLEGGGERSATGEILNFVREVFSEARPLIQEALKKPEPAAENPPAAETVAPAAAIPAASAAEDEEYEDVDLTPALAFIKGQLQAGIDPKALASLVMSQMDQNPESKELLTGVVETQTIHDLVALDPELAAEPMRTTFGQFYGELSARILAGTNSGGDSGNKSDARPDGRLHAPGAARPDR